VWILLVMMPSHTKYYQTQTLKTADHQVMGQYDKTLSIGIGGK
jgi:hypothetical protein